MQNPKPHVQHLIDLGLLSAPNHLLHQIVITWYSHIVVGYLLSYIAVKPQWLVPVPDVTTMNIIEFSILSDTPLPYGTHTPTHSVIFMLFNQVYIL